MKMRIAVQKLLMSESLIFYWSPLTTTLFRPPLLASYIALSASSIKFSTE